ncbi:MAG TPA: hypothetical protein VKW06_12380 [Candidatus Angelobacter sp.]|nr:hypothetical protein [Candidatus Angelobacter sp.]
MLVIVLALGALAVLYFAVRSRREQSRLSIQPVDLEAFRTLSARDDEFFLRGKLPNSSFRRLKRQRILVTLRYVSRIAGNAAVVMRLGHEAHLSPNPEVARAALQITELAGQIRLQCLLALAKLSVEFAVPSLQLTPAVLVPAYQNLRENVMRLGTLETQSLVPVAI